MKKHMIAVILSAIALNAIAAKPATLSYQVTWQVGESSMAATGVAAEGSALPLSVTREQNLSCKLKDAAGKEQTLSFNEIAGTSITIIPIEKKDGGVKTALRISETTGLNKATQLNADCSFPEGSSKTASLSTVTEFVLGKPQSFTLPNGSTVKVTATLGQ